MRLRILSDLHLELEEFGPRKQIVTTVDLLSQVEQDIILLVGDTHTKNNAVRWFGGARLTAPIYCIAGNHEFFGSNYPCVLDELRNGLSQNPGGNQIRILENESVDLGGWFLFGATMWTDFCVYGDPVMAKVVAGDKETGMKDYKFISHKTQEFNPDTTAAIHEESREALISFLELHDPSHSIVMTHHAPSPRSIDCESFGYANPVNAAYASDLEWIIKKYQPRLWIHGHVHGSFRYHIGNTEVICNPRGYSDNPNPNFNPHLVVDLN